MPENADVIVSDQGSIVLFTPLSDQAKAFIDENVHVESWMWMGPAFAVESRFAGDIIAGMEDDGLTVSV